MCCKGEAGTTGPDHPVPSGRLWGSGASLRLAIHFLSRGGSSVTHSGDCHMTKELVHRSWRLAVTVGPLVAIALSLAAGLKWR